MELTNLKNKLKEKLSVVIGILIINFVSVFQAYADVQQATEDTTNIALNILFGPIAKFAAAICAILLFVRLIQRDLASVCYLLCAAIVLFKLQDIVKLFVSN